jgi:hypothetical protein
MENTTEHLKGDPLRSIFWKAPELIRDLLKTESVDPLRTMKSLLADATAFIEHGASPALAQSGAFLVRELAAEFDEWVAGRLSNAELARLVVTSGATGDFLPDGYTSTDR